MPFVSRETLDQDQQERWRLEDSLDDVRGQLAVALAAGNIVEFVAWRIAELKESGVVDQEAANMVQFELEQAERAKITSQIAEGLKDRKRKEVEKRIRITEGPSIKAELEDLYKTDGTFELIKDDVAEKIRQEIADEIHAAEETRVRAELSDPAERQEIIDDIMAQLRETEGIAKIRAEIRQVLENEWAQEAADQLAADINAEEEAREEEYKKSQRAKLEGDYYMREKRQSIQRTLQSKWADEVSEKLAEEVESEELANIVKKRIELETQKVEELTQTVTKEKLHEEFTTTGVNTDELKEGAKVVLLLGGEAEGIYAKRVKDSYYGGFKHVNERGTVIAYNRKLTLIKSADDGLFHVQEDSLGTSDSVYEQAAALANGTTIAIGRNIAKNGKNVFEHRISQNVSFAYDDNADDDHIVDAILPVANMSVDGTWARDIAAGPVGSDKFILEDSQQPLAK